jgi:hypothetical protein
MIRWSAQPIRPIVISIAGRAHCLQYPARVAPGDDIDSPRMLPGVHRPLAARFRRGGCIVTEIIS